MTDMVYAPCKHGHNTPHQWAPLSNQFQRHDCDGGRPLGEVADIEQWKAKAEAFDKAEKRCDSCGMPPEEVGDRCSFTGGRHWWVRVVPEIGDTE